MTQQTLTYLQTYLQEVTQIYQRGNATEHTYRPAFQKLMESLDNSIRI